MLKREGSGSARSTFKIMVDTCVWLDLAKDPKQTPVLAVVEDLVRTGELSLLVPAQVLVEFRRNRERIGKESAKSLSSHVRLVKDAATRSGNNKRKTKALVRQLEDLDHKIPLIGGHAAAVLDRIEKLLLGSTVIDPSEQSRLRAAQRALEKKAPFHRDRNGMADALIIETYADCVKDQAGAGTRFAFVTHNKHDFSADGGNHNEPHADIAAFFSRIKSLYFINLVDALRRIDPSRVTEVMWEHSWTQEPRGLHDILSAERKLFDQVWYNRHQNLRIGIERGDVLLVDKETYPRPRGKGRETCQRDVWELAKAAARRVEQGYAEGDLGPWDDFERGMINGKLSALRWVLGEEWDFLDT